MFAGGPGRYKAIELESPLVCDWMRQFKCRDLPTVRTLLESLVVPTSTLMSDVLCSQVLKIHKNDGKEVACYAVRKTRGGYFPSNKKKRPTIVANTLGRGTSSSAVVARWVTSWSRQSDGVLDHPSLFAVKESRCDTLVFVDDIVGSGDTATAFLDSIIKSKTIRSWLSGRHVRVVYLTYVGSRHVIRHLGRMFGRRFYGRIEFVALIPPDYGRKRWGSDTLGQVRDLLTMCSHATKNTWMIQNALGYGNVFGTVVFEYGCPNNTPALLWHPCQNWSPLFRKRAVPTSSLAEQSFTIANSELRVFLALSKGLRRPERLAEIGMIDVSTLFAFIERLREHDYLDRHWILTPLGRSEARMLQRTPDSPERVPEPDRSMYFPRTLRSARAR